MSSIDSFVHSLLGTLPIELTFLYSFGDIIVLVLILLVCVSPFVIAYNLSKR